MAGAGWRSVDGSPCRWWQEDTDQWAAAPQSRRKEDTAPSGYSVETCS